MVLGLILLGAFISIVILLFIFDPTFRGWIRLKQGFCPLCNSSPPSELCDICHGETNYGQTLSFNTREVWRERYRTYLYLKKEQ